MPGSALTSAQNATGLTSRVAAAPATFSATRVATFSAARVATAACVAAACTAA